MTFGGGGGFKNFIQRRTGETRHDFFNARFRRFPWQESARELLVAALIRDLQIFPIRVPAHCNDDVVSDNELNAYTKNGSIMNRCHVVEQVAVSCLLRIFSEDYTEFLRNLHLALDGIDDSMHDNETVIVSVIVWRKAFNAWRKIFRYSHGNFVYLKGWLAETPIDGKWADHINNLSRKMHHAKELSESMLTTLMLTMSIIESERAISQAGEISDLTKLAFVFIPLTLIAGVFGMNIVVCCARPEIPISSPLQL